MNQENSVESSGPRVVTFGCRLNSFESEVMREHAQKAGWNDAIIINSCAVTAEAERQLRQAIRKMRRENPNARIVVAGCAAQINPKAYGAMPEVDFVMGNAEKMRAESYDFGVNDSVLVSDISNLKETARHLVGGFDGRNRAFIEIQQGCDHHCSFCVIPFGRGANRSAAIEDVVRQISVLVSKGYKEAVLTGVDICSWGADLEGRGDLARLVAVILEKTPALLRLRLSSLDPAAVDDSLIGLIRDQDRIMPHFHLSVQAGDDMVLRRMKRRHSRDDVLSLANRLRSVRPDAAIGADMIAGFPTETEAMFENGAALIGEAGFSHLHVFPYSPRPGTPAAGLPQLERALIKERARRMRRLGEESAALFLAAQIGRRTEVLVEKEGMGHSPHYSPVRFEGKAEPGDMATVLIERVKQDHLEGRIVS